VGSEDASQLVCRAINEYFASAKRSQTLAIAIQIFILAAGIIAVFVPELSPSYPPVAVVSAMFLAAVKFHADNAKSKAESLKRVYEFADSFGEGVAKSVLADLDVTSPRRLSQAYLTELGKGLAFSSSSTGGARRALENLQESAWWSKCNARVMVNVLGTIVAVVVVTAVIILIDVVVQPALHDGSSQAVGRIVASTLLCIFSLNMIPAVVKFHRFASKAAEVDAECDRRLAGETIDPVSTMRLLTEYQISRASAPMIPTFIWKLRRDKLDAAWSTYKARSSHA
jgi:hypothetical protein